MSNINSIDKYGFSKLLYTQFWKNKSFQNVSLKKNEEDNSQSLKKYLDSTNPRNEIINVYKKYTVIDFKDYLDTGYSNYLDETYNIKFEGIIESDIWKYIKTKRTNNYILKQLSKLIPFNFKKLLNEKYFNLIDFQYSFNFDNVDSSTLDFYIEKFINLDIGILKQISQKIKFTKQQKEKISDQYELLEFPINYAVFDINTVIKRINLEIDSLNIVTSYERLVYKDVTDSIKVTLDNFNDKSFLEKIKGDFKVLENYGYLDSYSTENIYKEWYEKAKQIMQKNLHKIKKLRNLLLQIEKNIPKSDKLEEAIKSNNILMIKELIEKGVKTSPKLFTLAIEHNNTDIVAFLLSNEYLNIDVNEIDYDYDCYDCDYSNLQKAIDYDNIKIVKLLIEKYANINYENNYGESPIFNACQVGNINIVKLLVTKGLIISSGHLYGENKNSFEKFTFLLTLSSKNPDIIDFLIRKKDLIVNELRILQEFYADYELNSKKYSLFEYAIKKGDLEIVRLLIEYEKKETDENLLELSAKYNNTETFRYLFTMDKFVLTDVILNLISSNENEELIYFFLFEVKQYKILNYLLLNKEFFDRLVDDEIGSVVISFLESKESINVLKDLLIAKIFENDQLDSIYENIENGLNIIHSSEIEDKQDTFKRDHDEIFLEHYRCEYYGKIPEYDYRNCDINKEALIDILLLIHLLKEVNNSTNKDWAEIKKSINFSNKVTYSVSIKTYSFDIENRLLFREYEFINLIMSSKNLKLTDFLLKNKDSLIDDTELEVPF